MIKIPSFKIDHTRLKKGIYPSRMDDDVITWDIRMKLPNHDDYLSQKAIHTIEHLFATYARNSVFKDGIIYVGPMGCRTGMYLLTRGLSYQDVLECVKSSFRFMSEYDGKIPGATIEECGNYLEHDLKACREESVEFLKTLENLSVKDMHYVFFLS